MLKKHSNDFGFREMVFVDLGCGDMNVGKQLIPLCKSYTGADVVRYVIERNRSVFKDLSTDFVHCDIVNDQLPDGDVCFLRQVLQHLSNDQIRAILPKLRKYRFVYITEHVPKDWNGVSPNLDKPQGRGIRLDQGSGIDLTKNPFGIPEGEIDVVLEVAGNSNSSGLDPGVIRTLLFRPDRVLPN
ncbi:MAG: methyltransferase domain-containing protein [Luteolibacter sp.]